MDPQASKSALRNAIKERLSRLSAKDRAVESRSICRRILENLPEQPTTVCAYVPMGDEVDIRPVLAEIIGHGHVLYLPRKEGNHFAFRKAETVDALENDDFGIPAPPADAALLDPQELSIALIPGRAFDRSGNRMGRGNGGYDIWMRMQRAQNARSRFWGIAFECQFADRVPMEAHDERVDALVTARRLVNTAGNARKN